MIRECHSMLKNQALLDMTEISIYNHFISENIMTDIVRRPRHIKNNMRKKRQHSFLLPFVRLIQTVILFGIAVLVGIGVAMFISMANMLPTNSMEAPEATLIYSADGVLLGRIFEEDRTNIELKNMPKNIVNATVAIEDERFYSHSGIDFRGIGRAFFVNLSAGTTKEGGSTITQQLARNIYLSADRTITRKVREAILALLLEKNLEKDKILELYLNRTFYGNRAFGVQAASKVYFGKDVNELTLSQCALIAGLPARPSGYAPTKNIDLAIKRRNIVLDRMARLGYITELERDDAKNEKVVIVEQKEGRNTFKSPHFVNYVINQLRDRYGEELVYKGGLRVYTTLNYEMQQIAEEMLQKGVARYSKAHKLEQGAFAAIDSTNGDIKVMVGSAKPDSEFNRCVQGKGRQPGSLFKAFVYTAAISKGMKPSDKIVDEPVTYRSGGKNWSPKNYDRHYHGSVTMKRALAQSINIPAVKVCAKIGPKTVVRFAQAMGITSELEPYLAIALGGVKGVKLLDICSAYGTFANDGVHMQAVAVKKVTNTKGDVIEENTPKGNKVISPAQNKMMDEMFRATIIESYGTGARLRAVRDARGKTGTTNDNRDAWWAGYVPNGLVAVCWVGNDDNSPMRNAWGSNTCGVIWQNFMLKAVPIFNKTTKSSDKKKNTEDEELEKPKKRIEKTVDIEESTTETDADEREENEESGSVSSDVVKVKVCNTSSMVATPRCPGWHYETFVVGSEPTVSCTTHPPRTRTRTSKGALSSSNSPSSLSSERTVTITVCSSSGMIAGRNCPSTVRKTFNAEDMPSRVCNVHDNN